MDNENYASQGSFVGTIGHDGGATYLGDWVLQPPRSPAPRADGTRRHAPGLRDRPLGGDDSYAFDADIATGVPPPDNRVWQTAPPAARKPPP